MTDDERRLLLTVARILKLRIQEDPDDPTGNNRIDREALQDALAPFAPSPVHGGDFAQQEG